MPRIAANRLDFARWLVDRRSPTTARSIVNRIWQAYFGTGLVATAEDLGTQGDPPSNPELLDWLAVELMDHDWSLKHIHRLIVTSATYQQSSAVTPELLERDPANRLLARGPRFRVDAEDGARHRTCGERAVEPTSRRAERLSAGARVFVPAAGELRAEDVAVDDGARPVSARAVHVPFPLGAVPGVAELRRAERRSRLRPPRRGRTLRCRR